MRRAALIGFALGCVCALGVRQEGHEEATRSRPTPDREDSEERQVATAAPESVSPAHFPHFRIYGFNDPYWYWEEYCEAQPQVWAARRRVTEKLRDAEISERLRRSLEKVQREADAIADLPIARPCLWLYEE